MKPLTKLTIIAAAFVAIASSAAFADDPQLQNRLAVQNAQNSPRALGSSTVALYSSRNGINSGASRDESAQVRFQVRSNSHGQVTGSYESVQ